MADSSSNKKPVFALIDSNNFFVSCERAFAPRLENKAIVVLSGNDGCVIARSNEAKELDIKMGAPFYKYHHLEKQNKIEAFSANFDLYADMSARIMQTIRMFCSEIEVYSIDEAFFTLTSMKTSDYDLFLYELRKKIRQWTGIPVSIGIANSKTLAKLANNIAKKQRENVDKGTKTGICNLINNDKLETILSGANVEDIWGIGKKVSAKLNTLGIFNAKQLSEADPNFIKTKLSVNIEKILYELRGISCFGLETVEKPNKTIIVSRSFGRPIISIEELGEALSNYINSACIKLREQKSRTGTIEILLQTNPFRDKDQQYKKEKRYKLPYYSSDTAEIIYYAKQCLVELYKPGYRYHKVGITLLDLQSSRYEQMMLFASHDYRRSDQLMETFDIINKTMGENTVFLAAQGAKRNWQSLTQKRSHRYTTNWNELPRAY